MKFVEFLNENKTEKLITPAILKREFKEEFGLIRPKIKVDMYTEKNHKDTETKYVEHDNSTYAAIEHFFIKQGGRQDDKQFFVFNEGTKKQFSAFISIQKFVYEPEYNKYKNYICVIFDVDKNKK